MNIAVKIIISIVAFIAIAKLIAPLLLPVFPPFGLIVIILLYIAVVAWLLGWTPLA